LIFSGTDPVNFNLDAEIYGLVLVSFRLKLCKSKYKVMLLVAGPSLESTLSNSAANTILVQLLLAIVQPAVMRPLGAKWDCLQHTTYLK
jgi:hypothetical protein